MDKAVEEYRKRRQIRLDAKKAVADYKQRRYERIMSRAFRVDNFAGMVYATLKDEGIDTQDMELPEAIEKFNELKGKNGGGSKDTSAKTPKEAKTQSGSEPPQNKAPVAKASKPTTKSSVPASKGLKTASESSKAKKSAANEKPQEAKGSPETSKAVGYVKTGKNGNLIPKTETAKTIDVKGTIEHNKDGSIKPNSLTKYIDKDGNLSPERQAVHDEIIKKFFAEKVPFDGQATMIMAGGGPASGKSFISKGANSQFGKDTTVKIDPDEFKAMLPGFKDMAIETDEAAGFYHEESSALAKRAYQFAADNNLNVVYDGTGDGSVKSVMKKLQTARDAGYKITGQYVTVDTDEAVKRNQQRYENALAKYNAGESEIPPRLVYENYVRDIHSAVSDISIQVANLYDSFELYDNNVPQGSPRILIATCSKGGDLTAVKGQEDKLQRYLNKGKSGAKVVNGVVKN